MMDSERTLRMFGLVNGCAKRMEGHSRIDIGERCSRPLDQVVVPSLTKKADLPRKSVQQESLPAEEPFVD